MFTKISLILLIVLLAVPVCAEEAQRVEIKPVLLVMDVQNEWMPMMDAQDTESGLAGINEAIALFREFDRPVVRVYHSHKVHGPKPGTEGFEFVETVAITETDPQVIKHRGSAFSQTELTAQLQEMDVNSVFLCGLSATGCVLATYFGAGDRDFYPFMIEGALISHDAAYTKVIEDICSSVTLAELKDALEDPYFE